MGIQFKRYETFPGDSTLFRGKVWVQSEEENDMGEFDAPRVDVEVGSRWGTDFTCELVVGGGEQDVGVRLKLPFTPTLHVAICGRRLTHGLRQRASAWAKKQAEQNSREGRDCTYQHELDPFNGRVTGVYLFEDHLVFSLWKSMWGSGRDDKKVAPWKGGGWSIGWFVKDVLLGGYAVETQQVGDEETVTVRLPEGDYHIKVKMELWEGRRPRWLKVEKVLRAHIDAGDTGVPIPGKGENSWDCGDDAVYSVSMPAKSVGEAVEKFTLDIIQTRLRRSGTCGFEKTV